MSENFPAEGTVWVNKSGRSPMEYSVVAVANVGYRNPDYPPVVVYRGANGFVWTCLASLWMDKMVEAPR